VLLDEDSMSTTSSKIEIGFECQPSRHSILPSKDQRGDEIVFLDSARQVSEGQRDRVT
jgi:hypothetical protein